MQLIVFSGLPGTGKSTLAEAVARELGIPLFAKDCLEAAIVRSGMTEVAEAKQQLGWAGYELLTTLAGRHLRFGQSVILDSVASTNSIRSAWRSLARTQGAEWRVIECVCSNENVHRGRVNSRKRNIPAWPELTWADVERVQAYYAPWTEERLIVDAVAPMADNINAVLSYLKPITEYDLTRCAELEPAVREVDERAATHS